jgi:hypothetical protein
LRISSGPSSRPDHTVIGTGHHVVLAKREVFGGDPQKSEGDRHTSVCAGPPRADRTATPPAATAARPERRARGLLRRLRADRFRRPGVAGQAPRRAARRLLLSTPEARPSGETDAARDFARNQLTPIDAPSLTASRIGGASQPLGIGRMSAYMMRQRTVYCARGGRLSLPRKFKGPIMASTPSGIYGMSVHRRYHDD